MTDDALQRARGLLADVLGLSDADLPEDAGMTTIGAWDSLAHVRILLRVEEALGRGLEIEEALAVRDVGGIARLLPGD